MSHLSAHFYTRLSVSQKFVKIREIIVAVRKNKSLWIYSSCFGANQSDNSCTEEATTGQALKKQKKGHRPLSHPAQCQECGGDGRRWELHEGCRRLQPSSRTGIWSRRRTARALCGLFGRGVVVAAPVHLMSLWFVWFILPKFHWLWVRLSQSSVPLTLWAA